MDPAQFVRGNPWPTTGKVPYPRAKPGDTRIPGDTWYMATFPVGVRLELTGDADAVDITYECVRADVTSADDSGSSFESWSWDHRLDVTPVTLGKGQVRLQVAGESVIYLPERLSPRLHKIHPVGGSIRPAPPKPRWLCYGDSIAAGRRASSPALGWPARVARDLRLDVANLGYSGAGRGELVSAEHIAELPADIITLTHGTNCWNRLPFSTSLMRENTLAFLRLVRAGHARTPIVVCSPPLRPEAEDTPNALGATLGDLRAAMADAAKAFDGVTFVDGRDLITADMLADNVHPNDAGHEALARALGPIIAEARRGA